jgi:hypothetical protein
MFVSIVANWLNVAALLIETDAASARATGVAAAKAEAEAKAKAEKTDPLK